MKKNPVFEENYNSEIVEGIHILAHYSIRIMKGLCYADRHYYENVNYFVLVAIFLTCLNEISYLWLIWRSKK